MRRHPRVHVELDLPPNLEWKQQLTAIALSIIFATPQATVAMYGLEGVIESIVADERLPTRANAILGYFSRERCRFMEELRLSIFPGMESLLEEAFITHTQVLFVVRKSSFYDRTAAMLQS